MFSGTPRLVKIILGKFSKATSPTKTKPTDFEISPVFLLFSALKEIYAFSNSSLTSLDIRKSLISLGSVLTFSENSITL